MGMASLSRSIFPYFGIGLSPAQSTVLLAPCISPTALARLDEHFTLSTATVAFKEAVYGISAAGASE